MSRRLLIVLSGVLAVGSGVVAVACKSNDITQNNNNDYTAYVSQAVSPDGATPVEVDGPDGAKVVIDPGSLAVTTTIGIGKMRTDGGAHAYSDLPPGWQTTGGIYSFEPHAQTFGKPVHITVPFVDNGQPLRLVGSELGGGWSPIDGVALRGGSVTFDSPHFSFYTVVTGAPAEPRDAGADAPSDATVDAALDAPAEAAALPPPTTLFIASQTDGTIYRYALAADGTPSFGGSFAGHAGAMAMSASHELFVVDSIAGDVHRYANPWMAAPSEGTPIAAVTTSGIGYFRGELWIVNGEIGTITAYDVSAGGATATWTSAPLMIGALAQIAFDDATSSVYVGTFNAQAPVVHFTLSGSGASRTLTKGETLTGNGLATPFELAVTPWRELAVSSGSSAFVSRWLLGDGGVATTNDVIQPSPPFLGVAGLSYFADGGQLYVGQPNDNSVRRFAMTGPSPASEIDGGTFRLPDSGGADGGGPPSGSVGWFLIAP